MTGACNRQLVVEADGGVYPCDFYVLDKWYMGNIRDMEILDLGEAQAGREFVECSRHVSPECRECKWQNLCRGGCRRTREPFEDNHPILNYFCPTYKAFFEYAYERMCALARKFSAPQPGGR